MKINNSKNQSDKLIKQGFKIVKLVEDIKGNQFLHRYDLKKDKYIHKYYQNHEKYMLYAHRLKKLKSQT